MLRLSVRLRLAFPTSRQILQKHQVSARRDFTSGNAGASEESNKIIDDDFPPKLSVLQLPLYLQENTRFDLHGWREGRFRCGICDYQAERLTAREISMLNFMDTITDKPDWQKKIFDETIVYKWHEEAQSTSDGMISDKTFEWCIKELRDKSEDFEREMFVTTLESCGKCVKSDVLISDQLGYDLRQAVKPLLAVRDDEKDWHPNSESKVLNLVHPSLFPIVGGRSRILLTGKMGRDDCFDFIGKGALLKSLKETPSTYQLNRNKLCSERFQWLPSEVQFIDEQGTDVKITSYINNLHPKKHRGLYEIIEKFIGRSVTLWNNVLVRGREQHPGPRIKTKEAMFEPPQPSWFDDIYDHEDDLLPLVPKIKEYLAQPDNPLYADRRENRWMFPPDDPKEWTADDVWEAVQETYHRTRTIIHPEPGESSSYEHWRSGRSDIRLEEEFRKQGLQVIVKLSSIELTPETPDYPGGHWHLEGMLNEGIVATSIYYYDVHNVTESRIRFSQEATLDELELLYEQDDHEPLAITFGAKSMRDEPAVQEIGSIATRHGRIIAFPNTLRHKVEPFSLIDKRKSGHRRFLVLWLVNPEHRIASTADVPPQQLSWAEGKQVDEDTRKSLMTLDEAKAYRLELMKERTVFNGAVEANFETYNLCEH